MRMETAHYPLTAFDPDTEGQKQVKLLKEDFSRIQRNDPPHKVYHLIGENGAHSSVQEVLNNPCAIFSGVRDHQVGGVCYCGIPSRRWFNSGSSADPPPGFVFLVYVSPRGCVFEWRWTRADDQHGCWPVDWEDRFNGGLLWPKD